MKGKQGEPIRSHTIASSSANRRTAMGDKKKLGLRVSENTACIYINPAHVPSGCPHHNPNPSRSSCSPADPPCAHKPPCQSVHPLKELWFRCQPFLLRQSPRFAVDDAPDFWHVRTALPIRATSLHASLHGPVDFHATLHHPMIHFSALSTVPADSQDDQ